MSFPNGRETKCHLIPKISYIFVSCLFIPDFLSCNLFTMVRSQRSWFLKGSNKAGDLPSSLEALTEKCY
jgi:hypothetical protein